MGVLKNILIISSCRADYFLLQTLHETLVGDGFRVKFVSCGTDMCKAIKIVEKALKIRPDIVILLGDRSEILACAIPIYLSRIPIVHLFGGETTTGSCDNSFRDAITHLSQVHFVSNKMCVEKIRRLGARNIYVVGELGVENALKAKVFDRGELEKLFNFKFGEKNLLITYHPATLEENNIEDIKQLLEILDKFDIQKLFTKTNTDPNGREMNRIIRDYCEKGKGILLPDLGEMYFSMIRNVDGVVGNSSSGITEVPSLKVGTINIGNRQKGRLRTKSIIDCDLENLGEAIKKLYSKEFKKNLNGISPFGDGNTSKKISNILRGDSLSKTSLYQTRPLKWVR